MKTTKHTMVHGTPSFSSTGKRYKPHSPTRGAILVDICLVTAWGAMIPGLMWLGAAGGF